MEENNKQLVQQKEQSKKEVEVTSQMDAIVKGKKLVPKNEEDIKVQQKSYSYRDEASGDIFGEEEIETLPEEFRQPSVQSKREEPNEVPEVQVPVRQA